MAGEAKPKAREGLLTSDHSKRGRRYLAILDPKTQAVTLLEPWEHAVLILCDGTRDATQISKILEPAVEGEPVDLRAVQRCLKFFEREKLIDSAGFRRPKTELAPPSPRTLAGLQDAFREWHKDPVKTGQILSGLFPPPFNDPASGPRAGLDPTVALPDEGEGEPKSTPVGVGSTLLLADAESVFAKKAKDPKKNQRPEPETLIGPLAGADQSHERAGGSASPEGMNALRDALRAGAAIVAAEEFEQDLVDVEENMAELLEAVDLDLREVEHREAAEAKKKQPLSPPAKRVPPPIGKAIGGEAKLPEAKDLKRPAQKVLMSVEPDPVLMEKMKEAEDRMKTVPRSALPLSEAALRPTMVGAPPPEGSKDAPPVLLVPPRDETPQPSTVPPVMGSRLGKADPPLDASQSRPDSGEAKTERPQRAAAGQWRMDDELTARLHPHAAASLAGVKTMELVNGSIIEDVGVEGPTEGSVAPYAPYGEHEESTDRRRSVRQAPPSKPVKPPTMSMRGSSGKHAMLDDANRPTEGNPAVGGGGAASGSLSSRAREVFERLRKAGLKARTHSRDEPVIGSRRRDDENAKRFDEALSSLTAGELDVALQHFRRLHDKMPQSKRLAAFIDAIEAVRTGADSGGAPIAREGRDEELDTGDLPERPTSSRHILDSFEGVLEEVVAYGRCPACFSMVAKNFTECFACGFKLESAG